MFYPDLEQVRSLAGDYNLIPVSMEIYADMETPISLFKRFEEENFCFLLESVEGGEKWGRFSFIGKNPFLTMKSYKDRVFLEKSNGEVTQLKGNPVEILKNILSQYKSADLPFVPRFNGGAVGYFGYDLIRHYEELPNCPQDDLELPESHFMLTDEVIAFDHLKQKIYIIANLHTDGNLERNYNTIIERLKSLHKELLSTRWKTFNVPMAERDDRPKEVKFESNISKDRFCRNVEVAKEYIRNGDIFQVVLSQRLRVETENHPLNIYRALRVINPSPYMFYLKFKDYRLIGSSPEMLVRVEGKKVETCPIAGTKKRGATAEEDKALEKELLEDEKELAEHTMLVDLGRNDIGRVSRYGSVAVKNLMHIEKYSHVMHIVTNVEGELREDKTAFDALMSILPAGTLSGAPKVRAMEIIDELETVKRGPYGGAIGYMGFNGNLDSCITIRTIVFKDKTAYIQAGGGIVADSVPENEYLESLNKALAQIRAIEEAGEIL